MKVICWIVPRTKKSRLHLKVGFTNCTIRPSILILLKAMVNEQNTDLIIRKLGFSHYGEFLWLIILVGFGVCGTQLILKWQLLQKKVGLFIAISWIRPIKSNASWRQFTPHPKKEIKILFWHYLKQLNDSINLS